MFRLEPFEPARRVGNPAVASLRSNYSMLKDSAGELPEKIGVVSLYSSCKERARNIRNSLLESGFVNPITTYHPLELLEAALKVRQDYPDIYDRIGNEVAYRILSYLVHKGDILLDNAIPHDKSSKWLMAPLTPLTTVVQDESDKVYADLKPKIRAEEANDLEKLMIYFRGATTSWEDIMQLHAFFKERFETNNVSLNFPLNYIPAGYIMPDFYIVSLKDEIEKVENEDELISFIETGCKVANIDPKPEVEKFISNTRLDKFGLTERQMDFESLLESLSIPRVIITDIYIDRIPELRKMRKETKEFKLTE